MYGAWLHARPMCPECCVLDSTAPSQMGSEIPGVQPAPWAQLHEEVWVVTDPGGWWGGDPHPHMLLAILPDHCHPPVPWSSHPLPASPPRGRTRLTPSSMTYPWQFLSTSGRHRLCLPGACNEEREAAGLLGQPGCGDGKGGSPQAPGQRGGQTRGWRGGGRGMEACAHSLKCPSTLPLPSFWQLVPGNGSPGTPVFRES